VAHRSQTRNANPARSTHPCPADPAPANAPSRSSLSLFRELKTNGYRSDEIVALCTELIDLLTVELRTAPRRPRYLSRADDVEAATDPAG